MANQVQVTVYAINGMPQTESFTMSFLTNDIMVQEYADVNNASVNSILTYYPITNDKQKTQVFLIGETVDSVLADANDKDTTQVQATVYSENENPYKVAKKTNFPVNNISIWPVTNSSPVQSFIKYKDNKYYVSESQSTLTTSSNSGGDVPYTSYVARITQNGTVDQLLENTTGLTFNWSFNSMLNILSVNLGSVDYYKVYANATTISYPQTTMVEIVQDGNNDTILSLYQYNFGIGGLVYTVPISLEIRIYP